MTIGFGQIVLIFIIVVLLFGNFSNILKEVAQGIKAFQEIIKK
jgi:Sec-independent protein translocase protein TatA|tara:strand:+ start:807 stop:935 length:129 start_codon:yes stop_codon:yes gene_type:complete